MKWNSFSFWLLFMAYDVVIKAKVEKDEFMIDLENGNGKERKLGYILYENCCEGGWVEGRMYEF